MFQFIRNCLHQALDSAIPEYAVEDITCYGLENLVPSYAQAGTQLFVRVADIVDECINSYSAFSSSNLDIEPGAYQLRVYLRDSSVSAEMVYDSPLIISRGSESCRCGPYGCFFGSC